MQRTLFTTPLVSPLLKLVARLGLKLVGWKAVGTPPVEKNFVLVAAPHESNFDLALLLAIAFVLEFKLYWMGKDTLFTGPLGPIMRWMGGISVNRSKTNNLVEQMVLNFDEMEELVLTVTPEGTRSHVDSWKTGFYHVAKDCEMPIFLAQVDYRTKVSGVFHTYQLTDDKKKDIAAIQASYESIHAKFPETQYPHYTGPIPDISDSFFREIFFRARAARTRSPTISKNWLFTSTFSEDCFLAVSNVAISFGVSLITNQRIFPLEYLGVIFTLQGNPGFKNHESCIRTYSKSPGLLSIPIRGGAIQFAYFPASHTGFIRD